MSIVCETRSILKILWVILGEKLSEISAFAEAEVNKKL